jgi:hypothetical protein
VPAIEDLANAASVLTQYDALTGMSDNEVHLRPRPGRHRVRDHVDGPARPVGRL